MTMKKLIIALKLAAAIIMLQTLFFKFTGAEESIKLFSSLGMEPGGRIGTGIVELIASILLFVPGKNWIGAILGLGTMSGAIFFHLTSLGIVFNDDGGALFTMAVITAISCAIILIYHKNDALKMVRKS
jgi:uncharacterized membrane protein YphA (DoxX/SURF4 family)